LRSVSQWAIFDRKRYVMSSRAPWIDQRSDLDGELVHHFVILED